jgi:hypothetical protein
MKDPICRHHGRAMISHVEKTPFGGGTRIVWRCPVMMASGLQCPWIICGDHMYVMTGQQLKRHESGHEFLSSMRYE